MVNGKQRRAFISYSRINKEFAMKLATDLRTAGYGIWFDLMDIPTGARWDDEVEKALRECSIFMIILTPASIASENVKDEIGYAIDHGKRILPVLLEECDVPLRLRRFQYVDFTTKSFEEGFESAKGLLGDLVNEASTPLPATPPQVPSLSDSNKSPTKPTPTAAAATPKTPVSKYMIISAVAVLVLVVAGIGFSVLSSNNESPATEMPAPATDTPAPSTETITIPTVESQILFTDDFSDPNKSELGFEECCSISGGKFYMMTNNQTGFWYTGPSSFFGPDVAVGVNVEAMPGGTAGVYCHNKNDAFYLFQIVFDDSAAQIWYFDGTNWEQLDSHEIATADTYSMYGVCQGDSLNFYVNGAEAGSVSDNRLSGKGYVGVYIETSNKEDTTIEFDDFYVSEP